MAEPYGNNVVQLRPAEPKPEPPPSPDLVELQKATVAALRNSSLEEKSHILDLSVSTPPLRLLSALRYLLCRAEQFWQVHEDEPAIPESDVLAERNAYRWLVPKLLDELEACKDARSSTEGMARAILWAVDMHIFLDGMSGFDLNDPVRVQEPEVADRDIAEAEQEGTVRVTEPTTKGQRIRVKGGRLSRTQISLVPSLKEALSKVAEDNDTSASLIINELLEQDPRIQSLLSQDPE